MKKTFFEDHPEHLRGQLLMQTIYWVCLILTFIFVYLSYKFDEKIIFKMVAFVAISFRNLIRLFDIEQSRLLSKNSETFDFVFEGDPDGELTVLSTDFVLTMVMQSTFCFILCTIGVMHFKDMKYTQVFM